MPRTPRAEQFNASEIGIVHLVQRCVRRTYLAGFDQATGIDYSHRREWIRARMERLASVFAMDLLSYAILSNHLHIVARNRPDIVAEWSDQAVALRWLRIFPGQRIDEHLADPTTNAVDTLANNPERIQLIRLRLSDPSWFMKALCEPIARLANFQDKVTGHFWEGRFKAQAITDEAGLLACSMYVDLNPIRAAMASTPEESIHKTDVVRLGVELQKVLWPRKRSRLTSEPKRVCVQTQSKILTRPKRRLRMLRPFCTECLICANLRRSPLPILSNRRGLSLANLDSI